MRTKRRLTISSNQPACAIAVATVAVRTRSSTLVAAVGRRHRICGYDLPVLRHDWGRGEPTARQLSAVDCSNPDVGCGWDAAVAAPTPHVTCRANLSSVWSPFLCPPKTVSNNAAYTQNRFCIVQKHFPTSDPNRRPILPTGQNRTQKKNVLSGRGRK